MPAVTFDVLLDRLYRSDVDDVDGELLTLAQVTAVRKASQTVEGRWASRLTRDAAVTLACDPDVRAGSRTAVIAGGQADDVLPQLLADVRPDVVHAALRRACDAHVLPDGQLADALESLNSRRLHAVAGQLVGGGPLPDVVAVAVLSRCRLTPLLALADEHDSAAVRQVLWSRLVRLPGPVAVRVLTDEQAPTLLTAALDDGRFADEIRQVYVRAGRAEQAAWLLDGGPAPADVRADGMQDADRVWATTVVTAGALHDATRQRAFDAADAPGPLRVAVLKAGRAGADVIGPMPYEHLVEVAGQLDDGRAGQLAADLPGDVRVRLVGDLVDASASKRDRQHRITTFSVRYGSVGELSPLLRVLDDADVVALASDDRVAVARHACREVLANRPHLSGRMPVVSLNEADPALLTQLLWRWIREGDGQTGREERQRIVDRLLDGSAAAAIDDVLAAAGSL